MLGCFWSQFLPSGPSIAEVSCCVVKPSEVVEVGFLVFETDQTSGEPHATQWKIRPEKKIYIKSAKKIISIQEGI